MKEKHCRKGAYILIVISLLIAAGISGCNAPEQQKATVKLKWLHQAQFAGNYVAEEKGFYRQEGLDVELVQFSFEKPTIDAVANGEADFGITGADELLLARAKGIPIKAIAVIYRINPVCAYSLKESGITKPQDFIGKKVGLEKGTNVDILYYAMMKRLGIDRGRIKEIAIGYDATELLNGSTDVSTGYIINEPHQAIEAGYGVNTMLMADYGAGIYADVLFATEDTLKNRPEFVEGFLRATLRGWQYAIENEEEAVDIDLKYAKGKTRSHELYMLRQSAPLIHTGDMRIGEMEKEAWEQTKSVLREQGLLKEDIGIESAYTSEFTSRAYEKK